MAALNATLFSNLVNYTTLKHSKKLDETKNATARDRVSPKIVTRSN